MILVNEVTRGRVCLECRSTLGDEPIEAWMRAHMDPRHVQEAADARRSRFARRRSARLKALVPHVA